LIKDCLAISRGWILFPRDVEQRARQFEVAVYIAILEELTAYILGNLRTITAIFPPHFSHRNRFRFFFRIS